MSELLLAFAQLRFQYTDTLGGQFAVGKPATTTIIGQLIAVIRQLNVHHIGTFYAKFHGVRELRLVNMSSDLFIYFLTRKHLRVFNF
jgi:hypothetical protein